jgi:hypothetical protein
VVEESMLLLTTCVGCAPPSEATAAALESLLR